MSTARSSTEAWRSTADAAALFRFRLAGLRGRARRAAPVALGVIGLVTLAAAVLVSTHLRELAVQACQHALVLRGGSAVAEVSAASMSGEDGAGAYRALLD